MRKQEFAALLKYSKSDNREKLETDVRKWIKQSNAIFPKSRERLFIGWLDRQDAITSRECEKEFTGLYRNKTEKCVLSETAYDADTDVHILECSACGGTCEHVNGEYEYCPRCGCRNISYRIS